MGASDSIRGDRCRSVLLVQEADRVGGMMEGNSSLLVFRYVL